jgi:hypothetical protein
VLCNTRLRGFVEEKTGFLGSDGRFPLDRARDDPLQERGAFGGEGERGSFEEGVEEAGVKLFRHRRDERSRWRFVGGGNGTEGERIGGSVGTRLERGTDAGIGGDDGQSDLELSSRRRVTLSGEDIEDLHRRWRVGGRKTQDCLSCCRDSEIEKSTGNGTERGLEEKERMNQSESVLKSREGQRREEQGDAPSFAAQLNLPRRLTGVLACGGGVKVYVEVTPPLVIDRTRSEKHWIFAACEKQRKRLPSAVALDRVESQDEDELFPLDRRRRREDTGLCEELLFDRVGDRRGEGGGVSRNREDVLEGMSTGGSETRTDFVLKDFGVVDDGLQRERESVERNGAERLPRGLVEDGLADCCCRRRVDLLDALGRLLTVRLGWVVPDLAQVDG